MTTLPPPPPTNWPLVARDAWDIYRINGGKTLDDYKRVFHTKEIAALHWHNQMWLTEFDILAAKGKLAIQDGVIVLSEPAETAFNLSNPDDKRPWPPGLIDKDFAAAIIATRSDLNDQDRSWAMDEWELCRVRYMPTRLNDWYAHHLTESPLYPRPETLTDEEIESHYQRLMTAPPPTAEGQLAIF